MNPDSQMAIVAGGLVGNGTNGIPLAGCGVHNQIREKISTGRRNWRVSPLGDIRSGEYVGIYCFRVWRSFRYNRIWDDKYHIDRSLRQPRQRRR